MISDQNADSEELVSALRTKGYFIVPLSDDNLITAQDEMFQQYELFDARPFEEKSLFSLSPDALGENNGWHSAGGLSRYNQSREGIIFQATSPIWPMLSESPEDPPDDFSKAHELFRDRVYNMTIDILKSLASGLKLTDPDKYFIRGGTLDVLSESQYHVKKITLREGESLESLHRTPESGQYLSLRAHRDPSLISLVFHDNRSTTGASRGFGLQFKNDITGQFVEVSQSISERKYCIVIAGSILELLTNGMVKAPLHRVVSSEAEIKSGKRIAATFFFQPLLQSLLIPFEGVELGENDTTDQTNAKLGISSSSAPVTYGKWKAKAYESYYKGK